MISGFVASLLFTASFHLNFEGNNIEDHIRQKNHYYSEFSHLEKTSFCEQGDHFACKIVFLEKLNQDDPVEGIESVIEQLHIDHRNLAIYLLIDKKWQELSIEKLKIYMGLLDKEHSDRLYGTYLKKLYLSGDVAQFMTDYRQLRNSELTTYYIRELLKKDVSKALYYMRDLQINFSESFYDSISKLFDSYSNRLSGDELNEFRMWTLEYNYKKVRYTRAINIAEGWYGRGGYNDPYSWRAHLYRAMSYTKLRQHSRAQAIYRRLEKSLNQDRLDSADLYKFYSEYSYTEAALGNNQKSIDLNFEGYNYFLVQKDDDDAAASFLYDAADMSRLDLQFGTAIGLYSSYIHNYPDHGRIDVARFLLFWSYYRIGNLAGAANILDGIISDSEEMSYSRRRAEYWKGRVLENRGYKEEAYAVFCHFAKTLPASFYGSLAAGRVKHNQYNCPEVEQEEVYDEILFQDQNLISETGWIIAAMAVGERDGTRQILRLARSSISNSGGEMDRLITSYAARTVDYHSMATRMITSISNFSATSREYFKYIYTIAFEEEILAHADFYDVPPMFVFSIARQESLFNITAVSTSYAIGLLQILPSTAQILADGENYGKITTSLLKRPLTNARFGIRYLSDLLRRFDGNVPLAAAAYNAGPGRVGRWVNNNPQMEIDEYIEDIPIFQTRNYVKKVMGNYAIYNYIFEGKVYDDWQFDLPVK
jgi:soluble lytic murein transglycosylase-like protein